MDIVYFNPSSYRKPCLRIAFSSLLRDSRMHCWLGVFFYFAVWLLSSTASAKVVVLANRTVRSVTVEVVRTGEAKQSVTIGSGDSQPLFFAQSLRVRFGDHFPKQQFSLQASSAYFLVRSGLGGTLELEQIGLGEQPIPAGKKSPLDLKPVVPLPLGIKQRKPVTIAVKILVDDNEVTHRSIWEPRLRERIAQASLILEKHSGIKLRVVEVATWKSDNKQQSFSQTLRQFEREVKPGAAKLVIGFSSQYQVSRGRTHLGVTRWPMHSHILLRERSRNLLEVERLELLVHELGHYLGASHSPEPQSVMRPVLTRNTQRAVGSRIRFDPVNALIIAMMGEEMRTRGVRDIRKISPPTIKRLKEIYGVLKLAMPRDSAAQQYLRLLDLMNRQAQVARRQPNPRQPNLGQPGQPLGAGPLGRKDLTSLGAPVPPLVLDTQKILARLMLAAGQMQAEQSRIKDAAKRVTGDELTTYYVRQAAQAAARLRSSNNKRALLLALGIFVDDTNALRDFPGTSEFVGKVEPDEQRALRLKILGKPTMRDRNDLTKHFFISAHLVVVGGKEMAASAGLAKERIDANGGTGFSFVDMAANRSGIAFAEHVIDGRLKLRDLAKNFHVDDYLPSLHKLDEGLMVAELEKRLGGEDLPGLVRELEAIEQGVLDLPVYDLPVE